MKVVYACYGGTHSSPVAAAIHLGWVSSSRPPSAAEILAIPRFDRASAKDQGVLEMMGRDEHGHEVYVMGRGPGAQTVERALQSGFTLAGGSASELLIVCTLRCVNVPMRVGGFTSRALGWTGLGRPLVVWGTQRAFADLVELVAKTKEFLRERSATQRS